MSQILASSTSILTQANAVRFCFRLLSPFPLQPGGQSEKDPEVCGLVISLRKGQHRIALWTKTCEESRAVPVAKKLKAVLKVRDALFVTMIRYVVTVEEVPRKARAVRVS